MFSAGGWAGFCLLLQIIHVGAWRWTEQPRATRRQLVALLVAAFLLTALVHLDAWWCVFPQFGVFCLSAAIVMRGRWPTT